MVRASGRGEKLRARIERVCRVVLPERRVYVLLDSQLAPEFRPKGCFAFTSRGLDLVLRNAIGRRWSGRGAAFVLCPSEAAIHARLSHRLGSEAIRARREAWKSAAHEVAHIVGRPLLPSDEVEGEEVVEFQTVVSDALASFCTNPPGSSVDQAVPWLGHDGRFIRALFHVAHRVRRAAGEWLPHGGWFSPRLYGVKSRDAEYEAALGDEPERLAAVPLTELSTIPAPEQFVRLWRADLQAWFCSLPTPSAEQTSVFVDAMRLFSQSPVVEKEDDDAYPRVD